MYLGRDTSLQNTPYLFFFTPAMFYFVNKFFEEAALWAFKRNWWLWKYFAKWLCLQLFPNLSEGEGWDVEVDGHDPDLVVDDKSHDGWWLMVDGWWLMLMLMVDVMVDNDDDGRYSHLYQVWVEHQRGWLQGGSSSSPISSTWTSWWTWKSSTWTSWTS